MNTPTIPTWEEAMEAVDKGKADPLETFVYNNEPAGTEESAKFRDELQKLVDHVFSVFDRRSTMNLKTQAKLSDLNRVDPL